MALCDDANTPFYFSDQQLGPDEVYRIFAYHFTDKDSWLLPSALEARGIMFQIDDKGTPLRIASRPMAKFFNLNEVSFVTHGAAQYVMTKADGSLISTFVDSAGRIRTKSKTSIQSDYAVAAQELLDNDSELLSFVNRMEEAGYTVNMEIVSPDLRFRIVLYYDRPKLIVLNARHRETGEYLPFEHIPSNYFTGFCDASVLSRLHTDTNIEGYVVIDNNGTWWKEKTDWYVTRHRAKDFVNRPLAFIELVLKDEADDVFALMSDQPEVLAELHATQHNAIRIANHLINSVTKFWLDNNTMTRKDYAIKGKAELEPLAFAAAMRYYADNSEPDWKKLLLQAIKKIDWTA